MFFTTPLADTQPHIVRLVWPFLADHTFRIKSSEHSYPESEKSKLKTQRPTNYPRSKNDDINQKHTPLAVCKGG